MKKYKYLPDTISYQAENIFHNTRFYVLHYTLPTYLPTYP